MPSYAQSILDYIQTEFLIVAGPESVTTETSLIEEGIVDSLGIFRLVSFLESTFGVEFEPADVTPQNFETIQAIAAFIQSKSANQS